MDFKSIKKSPKHHKYDILVGLLTAGIGLLSTISAFYFLFEQGYQLAIVLIGTATIGIGVMLSILTIITYLIQKETEDT